MESQDASGLPGVTRDQDLSVQCVSLEIFWVLGVLR